MEYTVKQISEKTNLKPYVLRYYEKEGLLPHVRRTQGGVRRYTDEDLEWISLICCLKNTGMSIKQIREFVRLSMQGPKTLSRRCELLEKHKRDVSEKYTADARSPGNRHPQDCVFHETARGVSCAEQAVIMLFKNA